MSTSEFTGQYNKMVDALRSLVTDGQGQATATVSNIGVESVDESSAVVLAFVDQEAKNVVAPEVSRRSTEWSSPSNETVTVGSSTTSRPSDRGRRRGFMPTRYLDLPGAEPRLTNERTRIRIATTPRRGGRPARIADALDFWSFAGGAANVVMQLSWPEVGHGVAESKVESGSLAKHPWKRARTTFTYLSVAILGSDDERRAYREAVNGAHRYVRSDENSPVSTTRSTESCSCGWRRACSSGSRTHTSCCTAG